MCIIPALRRLKQRITSWKPGWATKWVTCQAGLHNKTLSQVSKNGKGEAERQRQCTQLAKQSQNKIDKQMITSHQVLRFFLFPWEVLAYGLVSPPQL